MNTISEPLNNLGSGSSTPDIIKGDIAEKFNAIPDHGKYYCHTANPGAVEIASNHTQGIIRYKNFYITSSSDSKLGFFMVTENVKSGKWFKFDCSDYNHPGGIQSLGDYMVVPIEDGNKKSKIRLYNLSGMKFNDKGDNAPTLYKDFSIDRSKGASAAGITNQSIQNASRYVIAVYNEPSKDIDIYVAPAEQIALEAAKFIKTCSFAVPDEYKGFSSVSLVQNDQNDIYMIGMRKSSAGDDWADLFKIDIDNKQFSNLVSRRFFTESHTIHGVDGVRFRWATGIYCSDGNIKLLATQRNYVRKRLDINEF